MKVLLAILLAFGGAALIGVGRSSAASPTDTIGPLGILGLLLRLVAVVAWFWGLADYCRSKGRSPVYAALGLLTCIGLLILILLPDKYVVRTSPGYDPNSNYPR